MNILLFLIPVSLVLLLVAIWAFRWAVRKGQFENLDAAAIDILRDDSADQPPAAATPAGAMPKNESTRRPQGDRTDAD
ncbi:cbb3-type cytochrome oxidase assembly protein CcoS [Luteimonas sp. MC1750]|uniref:cbb3-type cytochrome oxidase assembly protein CcoS n=1 Tax=Luteimonas sp. MC1750 TaxID=2799326 RepID=UPI0018F09C7F|nr:cbb3-type cytochrome oxidase assembly protein CcoS [Luteimonas sp. MC1750]MBJ6984663.1 cbb3-type cytochrome oxidase assembly protein CcoS [Luteimonas sp. MC1750]QQO04736.1 cbb3-type cytochrome oxidase assembly protein CcoS [Luteimonas sp. MC1750]